MIDHVMVTHEYPDGRQGYYSVSIKEIGKYVESAVVNNARKILITNLSDPPPEFVSKP